MVEFKQDTEITPVLFRVSRAPKREGSEVTAVFPCEPATYDGSTMTCYAHIGQHSGCSFGWYNTTRPATPDEYADLKSELESAPYGYKLRVYKRITSKLRDDFTAQVRNMRSAARAMALKEAANT